MVYHQMSEEDVRNIMQSPYNMIGADGGVQTFGRGVPHPRSYGELAIDDDSFESLCISMWFFIGGFVAYFLGVEEDDICFISFSQ